MQGLTNAPGTQANQPARKIMTYTIMCFSLAGLIFGFAAGGFWGRAPHPTANTGPKTTPPVAQHTPSPTVIATATPENILLANPNVTHISSTEKADGTTSYTFSAQALDKSTQKPITATDVTCRLWLTQNDTAADTALSANNFAILRNIDNLNQPLPLPIETPGALNFTPPNQVQPCNANGVTTWTYTISPSIPPGTYYIYVLTDWKGRHFPWWKSQIQITA
jgi:hypothetical protein